MNDGKQVAIACQGGGSHTAFTAGVLGRVLPRLADSDHELVGLSGTSGGAFSALAGWYGLLADDTTPTEVLDGVWADIAARHPSDRLVNESILFGMRLEHVGVPLPEVSPYNAPGADWGRARLRRTLEAHVDFEAVPELATDDAPELVVGTVDIVDGTFETFTNGDVTVDAVLASAAVPELFRAVEIDGHPHWDGLLSQNPPIRDLLRVPGDRKPDELWVVQVNPQTRDEEPTSLREITDRRNELAGNLSLNQELHFLERINEWLEAGQLEHEDYTYTDVRRIQLEADLDYASKLDRSPAFIEDLLSTGREQAETVLADL